MMDHIVVDDLYRQISGKSKSQISEPELSRITDLVLENLTSKVLSGTIPFPYTRDYIGDIDPYFVTLQNIRPEISHQKYRLRSYYPATSGAFLPPLFRKKPTVITSYTENMNVDKIADYFIQEVRYNTKRNDQEFSILESWTKPSYVKAIMTNAIKTDIITTESLAQAITDTIIDVRLFKPSLAISILKTVLGNDLNGKVWIDISAGWGDRLLAAMAQNMVYTGYDPNLELQPGHSAMIAKFGNGSQQVIYQPFEEAKLTPNSADVVFSSPPFFDLEIYASDQTGQSVHTYPQFDQWLVRFLFRALANAWEALKVGGYLIIHLGDTRDIKTCEAMNIYIQNHLRGSSWEGTIGVQGSYHIPRPVWVWKKVQTNRQLWTSHGQPNHLNLYTHYPQIQKLLLEFNGEKYSPSYRLRRENISALRDIYDNEILDELLTNTIYERMGQDAVEQYLTTNTITLTETCQNIYDDLKHNCMYVIDYLHQKLKLDIQVIKFLLEDSLLICSIIDDLGSEKGLLWFVVMLQMAFP